MSVSEVAGIHAPFAQIVVRAVVVYIAIIIGMRLTGNRQLGQMTPFDLVLILLIANAVQNSMVGTDSTILGGLVAAGTLLAINRVVAFATDRIPAFQHVVEGRTVLLINDGRLLEDQIRHADLSDDLVLQAIREHGFDKPEDVRMAVLEIDGTISIVPKTAPTVRTRHRVRAVRPGGN